MLDMEQRAAPGVVPGGPHRVEPFPGMMIDTQIWRDAHDYHRELLRRHHLSLHGYGLVRGLEVSLVESEKNTLRIEPGIAIDPAGNFVPVASPQRYPVSARQPGIVFRVLQLSDVPVGSASGQSPYVREAYRIQERDRL